MMEFNAEQDGFRARYYPKKQKTDRAVILLFGDSDRDRMAESATFWFIKQGVNVMTMCPAQQAEDDSGYHSFRMDVIRFAARWLLQHGNTKVGIAGLAEGAMTALASAAKFEEFSLVLAYSPCDYVIQGVSHEKVAGMSEWPVEGHSSLAFGGKELPYQPFYKNAEEYWAAFYGAFNESKDVSTLRIFRESEEHAAIPEEAFIQAEKIHGPVWLFGAEDDTKWDSVRYIRRLKVRLAEKGFAYPVGAYTFQYGTRYIFPEGIMKGLGFIFSRILPRVTLSGRQHPEECRKSREEVERLTIQALQNW